MNSSFEFAEILDQHLRKTSEKVDFQREHEFSRSQNSNFLFGEDYAHLGFLLGQTAKAKPTRVAKYPESALKKGQTPLKQAMEPRPAHRLSDPQIQAYLLMCEWSPGLSPGFTQLELKKAYRIAVLKTHPDRGGSAQKFQAMVQAHQDLQRVFNE